MGFTSGFGIGFAARTSVLAIGMLNVMALSASPMTSTLDVSIHGLRSMKGNVLVCVTANPKFFPDCSKDPKSHRAKVAANNAVNVSFPGLTKGTYAVALIHDENGNSKMDMAIFLPKEGFGFSRNPAVVTGPPKFKAAAFQIDADEVNQKVKMKYML